MPENFISLEPGEHSFLGPSSASRWFKCPGQPHFSKEFENVTTEAAAQGTVAHWVGEQCLESGLDAHTYLGWEVKVDEFTFEVDEDMTDAVQVYLDHARETQRNYSASTAVLIEKNMKLSGISEDLGGTGDLIVYDVDKPDDLIGGAANVIDIIDYKHGRGVWVDVKDNKQLKIYALGAIEHVWKVRLGSAKIEDFFGYTIRTHIVQPRCKGEGGFIRIAEYTWGEIIMWGRKELQTKVNAVKPGAEICAGDHCRFCPCLGGCGEYRDWVKGDAKLAFNDNYLNSPEDKIKRLTADDLNSFLKKSTQIRDLLNAAERHAQIMAEKGKMKFPDFKLVRRKKQRAWNDVETAEKELEAKLGDEAYKQKLITPAQADKLLGKGKVDHLWSVGEGGLLLVDRHDKREEVIGESRLDFLDTHDLLQ